MNNYWHKQTDKPLFDDLLWSRPENKNQAGKLLIIGGNAHEFAAPAEAYQSAEKAGVGTCKVLLPNVLQKTIGQVLENAEFAPSNKSGGFARNSLIEWQQWAHWADAVLITGDLGRNSETAVVLESFLQKFSGQVNITKDAVDYFANVPSKLFDRPNTTITASFAQLQKMASHIGLTLKFSMTIQQIVELLHELTQTISANVITENNGIIFVAASGQVSTTKTDNSDNWRVPTAACSSVWWLQNPAKPFQALTTSVLNSHE